jgi:hypothetical protein
MRLSDEIAETKRAIERMFLVQVMHGKQSGALGGGVLACGQFVGASAHNEVQRGLFGTAAAISVLANSADLDAADAVARLVRYVETRASAERAIPNGVSAVKVGRDASNVLRQSEVLFALTKVPAGVARTDHLRSAIAEWLLSARTDDRFWGYFADEANDEPVPTAYAYLALCVAGYTLKLKRTQDYFREKLNGDTDSISKLLILHAIVRSGTAAVFRSKDLRAAFKSVQRVLASQLREHIEQNLEYWDGMRVHYVRIPWQLYYHCVEARLLAWWQLPSGRLYVLLRQAMNSAQSGGYKYPHSGRLISSRTSSVLHDVLSTCVQGSRQWFYSSAQTIERVRSAGRYFRTVVKILAFVFTMAAFGAVVVAPDSALATLAPGLLASLVIALAFVATKDK